MDLYREEILDHYKNPRNYGKLSGANYRALASNTSCGDMVEVFLKVAKLNSRIEIETIKFKGEGCALSIASASMLTEMIMNKELNINDLLKYSKEDMEGVLGVEINPGRERCVMLPLQAIKEALGVKNGIRNDEL